MEAFDTALTHVNSLSAAMQGILTAAHAADPASMAQFDVRFLTKELSDHVEKVHEVLVDAQG